MLPVDVRERHEYPPLSDDQSSRSSTFSDGRAITARSPTNTTGRSITSGCASSTSITCSRVCHVGLGDPERLELVVVGADERLRLVGDRVEDALERRPVGRRVEVAHDVVARRRAPRGSRARPATSSTTDCGRSVTSAHAVERYRRPPGQPPAGTRPRARRPRRACRRCGVVHCTSNSAAPSSRSSSTVAQHATFDASVTRWNIDSPANSPPMRSAVEPARRARRRATPRRCAPSPARAAACTRRRTSRRSSRAAGAGRRTPRITVSNAVSTRISKRASDAAQRPADVEPVERDHPARIGRPPREQRRRRASGTGRARYAASTVPGSRSPPTATIRRRRPAAGSGRSHRRRRRLDRRVRPGARARSG